MDYFIEELDIKKDEVTNDLLTLRKIKSGDKDAVCVSQCFLVSRSHAQKKLNSIGEKIKKMKKTYTRFKNEVKKESEGDQKSYDKVCPKKKYQFR